MSSWLAFHMIGLFPNAGQPYYLINAPLLKQSVLHQTNGKDFKITARNLSDKNQYIRAALLNGKRHEQAWITHQDIINGGELILEMSDQPSEWGNANLPPSLSN